MRFRLVEETIEETKKYPKDKAVQDQAYQQLQDIAQECMLKRTEGKSDFDAVEEYIKSEYRANNISQSMVKKLLAQVKSYRQTAWRYATK